MKTLKLECNDIKCQHRWEATIDETRICGNRIIGGLLFCPQCGRYDSPYVINDSACKRLNHALRQRKETQS